MTNDLQILRRRVRLLIGFFIFAVLLSGLTAFPIKAEADLLQKIAGEGSPTEHWWPSVAGWISFLHRGITEINDRYPFVFYGTDWLALAHIVIAIAFIGPLRDPVKNIWVVELGMIACILVIPLALIFGPLRGIPFFWRLIDCSFGVFGIVPLWLTRRWIKRIVELEGA
jgi:hypothetical protein